MSKYLLHFLHTGLPTLTKGHDQMAFRVQMRIPTPPTLSTLPYRLTFSIPRKIVVWRAWDSKQDIPIHRMKTSEPGNCDLPFSGLECCSLLLWQVTTAERGFSLLSSLALLGSEVMDECEGVYLLPRWIGNNGMDTCCIGIS